MSNDERRVEVLLEEVRKRNETARERLKSALRTHVSVPQQPVYSTKARESAPPLVGSILVGDETVDSPTPLPDGWSVSAGNDRLRNGSDQSVPLMAHEARAQAEQIIERAEITARELIANAASKAEEIQQETKRLVKAVLDQADSARAHVGYETMKAA